MTEKNKKDVVTASRNARLRPLPRYFAARLAARRGAELLGAIAGLALPGLALAGPAGGNVTAGDASISNPDASTTRIDQQSQSAILQWQSFSIGADEYVVFRQPTSSSVALNRVVGSSPSDIFGSLSANGRVFLVNPNGVYFAEGAQVDVGGLVATTLDIDDNDFLDNKLTFSGDSQASVTNDGTITATDGFVVLAGDYVENSGVISAQLGQVMLAAGSEVTLDVNGDGLVSYAIDDAAVSNAAGVNNVGELLADGGQVIMTAEVASSLIRTVVNSEGLARAQSINEVDGEIFLSGNGGNVVHAGSLDATGGGTVRVTSNQDIDLQPGSVIDVSNAAGKGGDARVIAEGRLDVQKGAAISATGGNGADGGFIEVSGHGDLKLRGDIDLGPGGTLLIDPANLVVQNGAGSPTSATVFEQDIESQLASGANVSLVASNTITVRNLSDNVLNGQGTSSPSPVTGGDLLMSISGSATGPSFEDTPPGSIVFEGLNDLVHLDGTFSAFAASNTGHVAVGKVISDSGDINLSDLKVSGSSVDVMLSAPQGNITTGRLDVFAGGGDALLNLNAFVHINTKDIRVLSASSDSPTAANGRQAIVQLTAANGNIVIDDADLDGVAIDVRGGGSSTFGSVPSPGNVPAMATVDINANAQTVTVSGDIHVKAEAFSWSSSFTSSFSNSFRTLRQGDALLNISAFGSASNAVQLEGVRVEGHGTAAAQIVAGGGTGAGVVVNDSIKITAQRGERMENFNYSSSFGPSSFSSGNVNRSAYFGLAIADVRAGTTGLFNAGNVTLNGLDVSGPNAFAQVSGANITLNASTDGGIPQPIRVAGAMVTPSDGTGSHALLSSSSFSFSSGTFTGSSNRQGEARGGAGFMELRTRTSGGINVNADIDVSGPLAALEILGGTINTRSLNVSGQGFTMSGDVFLGTSDGFPVNFGPDQGGPVAGDRELIAEELGIDGGSSSASINVGPAFIEIFGSLGEGSDIPAGSVTVNGNITLDAKAAADLYIFADSVDIGGTAGSGNITATVSTGSLFGPVNRRMNVDTDGDGFPDTTYQATGSIEVRDERATIDIRTADSGGTYSDPNLRIAGDIEAKTLRAEVDLLGNHMFVGGNVDLGRSTIGSHVFNFERSLSLGSPSPGTASPSSFTLNEHLHHSMNALTMGLDEESAPPINRGSAVVDGSISVIGTGGAGVVLIAERISVGRELPTSTSDAIRVHADSALLSTRSDSRAAPESFLAGSAAVQVDITGENSLGTINGNVIIEARHNIAVGIEAFIAPTSAGTIETFPIRGTGQLFVGASSGEGSPVSGNITAQIDRRLTDVGGEASEDNFIPAAGGSAGFYTLGRNAVIAGNVTMLADGNIDFSGAYDSPTSYGFLADDLKLNAGSSGNLNLAGAFLVGYNNVGLSGGSVAVNSAIIQQSNTTGSVTIAAGSGSTLDASSASISAGGAVDLSVAGVLRGGGLTVSQSKSINITVNDAGGFGSLLMGSGANLNASDAVTMSVAHSFGMSSATVNAGSVDINANTHGGQVALYGTTINTNIGDLSIKAGANNSTATWGGWISASSATLNAAGDLTLQAGSANRSTFSRRFGLSGYISLKDNAALTAGGDILISANGSGTSGQDGGNIDAAFASIFTPGNVTIEAERNIDLGFADIGSGEGFVGKVEIEAGTNANDSGSIYAGFTDIYGSDVSLNAFPGEVRIPSITVRSTGDATISAGLGINNSFGEGPTVFSAGSGALDDVFMQTRQGNITLSGLTGTAGRNYSLFASSGSIALNSIDITAGRGSISASNSINIGGFSNQLSLNGASQSLIQTFGGPINISNTTITVGAGDNTGALYISASGGSVNLSNATSIVAAPGPVAGSVEIFGGNISLGNYNAGALYASASSSSLFAAGRSIISSGDVRLVGDRFVTLSGSTLNIAGRLDVAAGSSIGLGSAQIDAANVTMDGGFAIFNSLGARITADGLAMFADSFIGLSSTELNIGNGRARDNVDGGGTVFRDGQMLQRLAEMEAATNRSGLVPRSNGPNLYLEARQVSLGPVNLTGDYVGVTADFISYQGPVTTPENVLVQYRPTNTSADILVEPRFEFGEFSDGPRPRATQIVSNPTNAPVTYYADEHFAVYPGTTIVIGGSTHNGNVVIGNNGPIDINNQNLLLMFPNSNISGAGQITSGGVVASLDSIFLPSNTTPTGIIDNPQEEEFQQEDDVKSEEEEEEKEGEFTESRDDGNLENDPLVKQQTNEEVALVCR